jgi:hypothetical protein
MFNPKFLKDAGERAVATVAQTFVALVGTDALDILSVDVGDAVKAAVAAGVLSFVKSVAASKVGDKSASAVNLG